MPASQEPRDGDFVAYIEALQRESEARLHLRPQLPLTHPAHPAGRPGESQEIGYAARHGVLHTDSAPVLSRQQAEELQARLARAGDATRTGSAGIALVIGIALLLFWFIGSRGVLPFLVGLALTLWSVSRLRQRGLRHMDRQRSAASQIAKLFGAKPPRA